MAVVLKNNAVGYLSTPISASDVGLAMQSGNGALFPALTGGQYFYATVVGTNGETEIVKVTARVVDALTIVRAQDSSTAYSFAAGSRIEMRVNAASVSDAISDAVSSITFDTSATAITITDTGGYYSATDVEGALQESAQASNIQITDLGGYYTGTDVEAALQEIGADIASIGPAPTAATVPITDSGNYYTGTTVEAALQETAQAANIVITDPGNYYSSSSVDGALQEAAQAITIKIVDAGSYYAGTTVEAALQEIAASVAVVGPTPTATDIVITDAGGYYASGNVEGALQESAQATNIRITDSGNNFTSTNVEGALSELATSVANSGAGLIHAVGRINAGATLSGNPIGLASVVSAGTGIYTVTLSTAISNQNNIVVTATADHNGNTTASYTVQCDVTSSTVIQVRTYSNGTNPVPTNIGFCLVVYNTTP